MPRFRRRPNRSKGKRRIYRRKRVYRRPKPFRMNSKGVYYFTRSFTADLTFTTDEFGQTPSTMPNSVALNLLPNYSDFTNLFDQYKIIGATMNLIHEGGNVKENVEDGLTPPIDQLPVLYTLPDIDDEGGINFNQVLEHGKMRMHQIQTNGKIFKKFYIPTYCENSLTGIDDLVAYAANPRKSPWLDTAQPQMTHGCLKLALSGSPNTIYRFKRIITLRIMCRQTR